MIQLLKNSKEKEVNIRRDAKVDLTCPLEQQVNLQQRACFNVQTVEIISELAQVDTKTLISIVHQSFAMLSTNKKKYAHGPSPRSSQIKHSIHSSRKGL